MTFKTIVALVLIASINLSIVYANQTQANHPPPEKQTNATQNILTNLKQHYNLPINPNSTKETLETAPSITSVHHQVWTSSSSGRLDELSPEVISKLRNDVPFLAAYALRPRLVGASSSLPSSVVAGGGDQQSMASVPYETTLVNGEPRLALIAPTVTSGASLDVGASSPQSARQSLVPKLGDFSEFNVETSSLSKSEHHHKRKTSLKRPKNKNNELSSARLGRKRAPKEDSLSQLVKRVKRKQRISNKQGRSSSGRRQSSKRGAKARGRSSRRKSSKRRGASKRSRSNKRRSNGSRRVARLLQDQSVGTNDLEDDQMGPIGRGDSSMSHEGSAGVKGGPVVTSGGDVKGGSSGGTTRKPPFFAAGQRPKQADKSPESVDSDETDRTSNNDSPNAINGATTGGSQADDTDDQDNTEIDDEPQTEPRRVGDDDVEEDGDTVLVEPKSDGVDDDPPLPDSPEGSGETGGADDESSTNGADEDRDAGDKEGSIDSPNTTTPAPLVPEGDPRGNRVNRQKPNELPMEGSTRDGGDGQDQVAGGGIGATIGGGKSNAAPTDGRSKEADADDDDDFGVRGQADGRRPKVGGDRESGVEFANDEGPAKDDDDRRAPRGRAGERIQPDDGFDEANRKSTSAGDASDGDFGERRQNDSASRGSVDMGVVGQRPGSSTSVSDDDLDYRDELERTGQKMSPSSTNGGDNKEESEKQPTLNDSTATGVNSTRQHPKTNDGGVHCDDGSYDHHGHHLGHDDHHHHDTTDWLRGSIPGEPDNDYPILSRVNVTNFSCADQKHPGYYADVDARCQIFHICQADGRQDSFLCPNGTIFSQKSLVCVWWNGFHCEDAPKFYHLNELLYKSTNGNESPQAVALPSLRPLDGAHLKPRSMKAANDGDISNADEDDSPIDSTQATMRGRRPHESSFARGEADGPVNRDDGGVMRGQADARNNIGPDDDATIQRKSTNLDEDSADESPARLRARDRVPRRRRRASARQAPPKLKSRRVSRNSRRRKLRHGIKPRRRA